jgi:hypothetical protein
MMAGQLSGSLALLQVAPDSQIAKGMSIDQLLGKRSAVSSQQLHENTQVGGNCSGYLLVWYRVVV